MTSDPRRFRSTDELMNAVFGSVPLSDSERKLREAEHAAAQVLPPPPQEVRPPGWLPRGMVTTNTDALAFRNGFKMPEEKDIAAGIAKTMGEVVRHQRKGRGG
jgi:hypothetical protein